jgi:hypothetical protein
MTNVARSIGTGYRVIIGIMRRAIVALAIVAGILAGGAAPVEACDCSPVRMCQAYWLSDAVFSGRVVAIDRVDLPKFPRRATFQVTEAFLGVSGDRIEIFTGMGGGDCGYEFRVGDDYIVYARFRDGRLTTGVCNRTTPLPVGVDVSYARAAVAAQGRTDARIAGRVQVAERRRDGSLRARRAMPGVTVTIAATGTSRSMVTDPSGRFEFDGLPRGRYEATLTLPDGYSSTPQPVVAEPGGCGTATLTVYYDRRAPRRP